MDKYSVIRSIIHSDIFDGNINSSTPFEENSFPPFSDSDVVMGIALSNSSLEAKNGDTKKYRGRLKDKIIGLCKTQSNYMLEDTKLEYELTGFSYMALPYGGGAANSRARNSRFKHELTDGMAFTGRLLSDTRSDQRNLYFFEQDSDRLFLFNSRNHVHRFKSKLYENLQRSPSKLELKEKFKDYIRNYDALKRKNMQSFMTELVVRIKEKISQNDDNEYQNATSVPESYEQDNPKEWFRAKFDALKQLHEEMRMIVVVRKIKSDCTFRDISRHENFRIAMENDKQYMFEYSCTCESALAKGFCGHIFFRKHFQNDYEHNCQAVPACCWDNSMNTEGVRCGRPRQMARALHVEL